MNIFSVTGSPLTYFVTSFELIGSYAKLKVKSPSQCLAVGCHQRVKSELFLISIMLHRHLHDFNSQQASFQADETVDAALAFACSIVHIVARLDLSNKDVV